MEIILSVSNNYTITNEEKIFLDNFKKELIKNIELISQKTTDKDYSGRLTISRLNVNILSVKKESDISVFENNINILKNNINYDEDFFNLLFYYSEVLIGINKIHIYKILNDKEINNILMFCNDYFFNDKYIKNMLKEYDSETFDYISCEIENLKKIITNIARSNSFFDIYRKSFNYINQQNMDIYFDKMILPLINLNLLNNDYYENIILNINCNFNFYLEKLENKNFNYIDNFIVNIETSDNNNQKPNFMKKFYFDTILFKYKNHTNEISSFEDIDLEPINFRCYKELVDVIYKKETNLSTLDEFNISKKAFDVFQTELFINKKNEDIQNDTENIKFCLNDFIKEYLVFFNENDEIIPNFLIMNLLMLNKNFYYEKVLLFINDIYYSNLKIDLNFEKYDFNQNMISKTNYFFDLILKYSNEIKEFFDIIELKINHNSENLFDILDKYNGKYFLKNSFKLKEFTQCHLKDIITTDFFNDFLLNIDENDKKFFSSFLKFITEELDYIPENQTKMFFDIILLNSLINSIEYKDNETSKNNYINEFVDKYKDFIVFFDYIPYIKESLNNNSLNKVNNENFENILSKLNSLYYNKAKNKKIKI